VRFGRDVKAMNALVLQAGLPPLAAMVLDNYLDPTGKSFAVGQVAERLMAAGGIHVIPSEPYIRQHAGHMQDWRVSPWEGHPNEQANRVYATEFARGLEQLPALQPYRRAARARAGDDASESEGAIGRAYRLQAVPFGHTPSCGMRDRGKC
ncbi:MAG TPA: hypothetical protein VN648_19355, partial [Candidatus Methylomirabilis sp.]|nr:hypothetical protein [Candidatus Methylomirabilis sp.]